MAWLYLSPELSSSVATGDRVVLLGDEARHAAQVARVRVGERIAVGNGRGTVATGTVREAHPGEVVVDVEERRSEPAPAPQLWLVQALAKGGRDELAVQAATELGVSGVIPWAAERSVVRWEGAKIDKGLGRWRSIVAEAAKQSIRAWVPEVAELATTRAVAEAAADSDTRVLVLEPTAEAPLSSIPLDAARILLVVGPEGGISSTELDRLVEGGAVPVRLGAEVLRSSTAGPAALAVMNARLGRW